MSSDEYMHVPISRLGTLQYLPESFWTEGPTARSCRANSSARLPGGAWWGHCRWDRQGWHGSRGRRCGHYAPVAD